MKTSLERVKQLAESDKKLRFNNLLHNLTVESVRSKISKICATSATGVDGMTKEMALQVTENDLQELINSVHRCAYKAPPVRRVYIPKPGKTEKRPIGIPTVLDRALQSAVTDILSAIYENDFLEFSYRGCPRIPAHNSLSKLRETVAYKRTGFVFEADLKNFFGSLDHTWMLKFLSHRISDTRILNVISRWLKAGVLENASVQSTENGVPQGGSISVILSNIYLHYVLDLWLSKVVTPRMRGPLQVVRYLDDFVICVQYKSDADKIQKVIPLRLQKFGLELEPNKTQLVRFGRFSREGVAKFNEGKQKSITFLGFDFIPVSHLNGKFRVQMQTNRHRLNRFLQGIKFSIRKNQHHAIKDQMMSINQKLRGHFNYFGIYGNTARIQKVRYETLLYFRKVHCVIEVKTER